MLIQMLVLTFSVVGIALACYTKVHFVPLRVNIWQLSIVLAVFFLVHYMLRSYTISNKNEIAFNIWNNFMVPLMLFAVALWAFDGKVWKKIFLYAFLLGTTVTCKFLASLAVLAVIGTTHNTFYADHTSIHALYIALIALSLLAIICGYMIWISRALKMRRFNTSFLVLPIFPFSVWIILYGAWNPGLNSALTAILGLLFGTIAIMTLMFVLLKQDEKMTLQDELRETRHAMELEQSHYQEVEKRHEEMTKIRHDFNNQLATIGGLIRAREEESAQDMINALSKDIMETKENPYCNIPVINAILLEKALVCEELDIELLVNLTLPPCLAVEQMHLCSIFGNILDNAINACKHMKHDLNIPTIQLYPFNLKNPTQGFHKIIMLW